MKRIIFLIFLFFNFLSVSQNLSIQETINYINNNIDEEAIVKFQNGFLTYTNIKKMEYNNELIIKNTKDDLFNYYFHVSDIKLEIKSPAENKTLNDYRYNNKWSVTFKCDSYDNKNCISYQLIDRTNSKLFSGSKNVKKNLTQFQLNSIPNDRYTNEKLFNALKYLIEKSNENGYKKPIEDDPFAPQNINNETIGEKNSIEIDLNPFLGKTTTSVNLRNGPSSNHNILKSLNKGSEIFAYSNKPSNNYSKVIDISSSDIGWIHKNYVEKIRKINVNKENQFKKTGYSPGYNPEIVMINRLFKAVSIVIGDKKFKLSPNSSNKIKIAPGNYYFIAISKGLLPLAGYQSFDSNAEYEWIFFK